MTQMPRKNAAGSRNPSGMSMPLHHAVCGAAGAPSPGGNSGLTAVLLNGLLAARVGLLGLGLQLLRDAVDVVRVPQEVLQQAEHRVAAERRGLEVGEVEPEHLGLG